MQVEIETKKIISQFLKIEIEEITSESTLKELGADSLDKVQIMMELEGVFEICLTPNYPNEFYERSISNLCEDIETAIQNNVNSALIYSIN